MLNCSELFIVFIRMVRVVFLSQVHLPVGGRKEVDMNYDFYYVLIVTLVLLLIAKPR